MLNVSKLLSLKGRAAAMEWLSQIRIYYEYCRLSYDKKVICAVITLKKKKGSERSPTKLTDKDLLKECWHNSKAKLKKHLFLLRKTSHETEIIKFMCRRKSDQPTKSSQEELRVPIPTIFDVAEEKPTIAQYFSTIEQGMRNTELLQQTLGAISVSEILVRFHERYRDKIVYKPDYICILNGIPRRPRSNNFKKIGTRRK